MASSSIYGNSSAPELLPNSAIHWLVLEGLSYVHAERGSVRRSSMGWHKSCQAQKFEVENCAAYLYYFVRLRSCSKSPIRCYQPHCKVSPSHQRYFLEQDSSAPQLSRQWIDSAVATAGQCIDFVRASSSRDCTLDVPPKRRSARATTVVPEPEDPRC